MRLKDDYEFESIIRSLEVALQIDGSTYDEKDVVKAIDTVKKRLTRQYVYIDFINYKIGDPEIEGLGDAASTVVLFLDGIASVHSKLCAYTQIVRYTCNCPVNLGRINYLGIEEDSLKTNIMKMERERMLPLVESVIKAIEDRLNSISYCLEKRIIMLLVVTYELGLYEITATIAELLHISMVG